MRSAVIYVIINLYFLYVSFIRGIPVKTVPERNALFVKKNQENTQRIETLCTAIRTLLFAAVNNPLELCTTSFQVFLYSKQTEFTVKTVTISNDDSTKLYSISLCASFIVYKRSPSHM